MHQWQKFGENLSIDTGYSGNMKIWDAFGHAVTVNFDLLTPKSNQFISVPRCTSDKSLAKIRQQILESGDIAETKIWDVFGHAVTLTFDPLTRNLISSSLSRDAPVTEVWRKSVNRYWRYRGNIKLPSESRTDGRTVSGTDGRPENI